MSDEAETARDPAILVDVWFDVRCPWCFLGKRRFDRAIEIFHTTHPSIPVTVQHHSFELAPGIPERFDGTEADYLLRYEGTPLEQSALMLPELRKLAASEGVELRFDELQLVNMRPAHRVFQLGQQHGVGEELLDRLFTAYFSEVRDLADVETLTDLAAELGVDRDEALAAATADQGSDLDRAVSKDHVRGEMLGATGVPFSLFNAKYRVSGGQSAEVFAGVLKEVARRDFGVE